MNHYIPSIITQEFFIYDIENAIKTAADPDCALSVIIRFEP